MSADPPRWRAPLMLVWATVFWAFSFPTMKAVTLTQQAELPVVSTWFISTLCMSYRFGLAAVIMAVVCARTLGRLTRLEIWEGVGLGLFASAGLVFQMDGLAYTSASVSAFLTQCYCLIIPLWLALRERRWPPLTVTASCILVIVGVAILSEVDWHRFRLGRGEAETLIASVIFTGQILWLQRPKFGVNNVNHFSLVSFVVIALVCLPLAWVTAPAPKAAAVLGAYATGPMALFMAILVLFCTLGGCLLMNYFQRGVTATQAGLIYCAEPIFTSVLVLFLPAWFSAYAGISYANETLRNSLLIGGTLITVANLLILRVPPEPSAAVPPAPDAPEPPARESLLEA